MAAVIRSLIVSAALGFVAAAPQVTETTPDVFVDGPDFNVTAALEDHGIFVDEVPGLDSLDELEKRSIPGCPSAVSFNAWKMTSGVSASDQCLSLSACLLSSSSALP